MLSVVSSCVVSVEGYVAWVTELGPLVLLVGASASTLDVSDLPSCDLLGEGS